MKPSKQVADWQIQRARAERAAEIAKQRDMPTPSDRWKMGWRKNVE